MKIPLFDLDGTLLQNGGFSRTHAEAYNFAFQTVFKFTDLSILEEVIPDGLISNQIFLILAEKHGCGHEEIINKLSHATDAVLQYFLAHEDKKQYQAHMGARELLETLMHKGVHCGVLTGNIEEIGWEKLSQAGLKKYISFGAFGNMAMKRVDLIPIAKQKYEEKFHEERPITDFVIIGDTPKDIQCAKDGSIQVIAVPTGNFSKEDLEKEKPDLLVESLEEKEKIIEFLYL